MRLNFDERWKPFRAAGLLDLPFAEKPIQEVLESETEDKRVTSGNAS